MRKKNVLFVAHHLTIGGVQKSLISALNAINYNDYNVTLYLRKNRLVLLPYVNKNVKVIINDDSNHYYRKPYAVWLSFRGKICNLLKKDSSIITEKLNQFIHTEQLKYERKRFTNTEFDVAVAYNEGYTAEFVMDCVSAERKIMFFQSSTDSNSDLHGRIIPMFDQVVVEHNDIKESVSTWYPKACNRITILKNYTDYRFLRNMSKEKSIAVYDDRITLCTCARFSKEKGIDLALEAARILKAKNYKFIWYILGDGSEMPKIQSMVRDYQLNDCISLEGMQTNPYPYMAACDIYVQPSREEALSIAMLESQILCAPMVSTKTAGGLAMIQEGVNGLLADISPSSLAEKIELLMKDDELRKQIKDNLSAVDYSEEEQRYKQDWEKLLS